MNNNLIKKFTTKELEEAIFQMHSLSSPGPDGFPPAFYQNHWRSIGKNVSDVFLYVLNSDGLVTKINETHIALILKIKSPSKASNFRL